MSVPYNGSQEIANLQSLGLDDLRHWRDALADYLDERKRLRVQG